MRLLILTQKVDENDPILGFFHGWIAEFAKHCEYVTVICLGEGAHHLPQNVKVLSLGKENVKDLKNLRFYEFFKKFRYVLHFWKYIWQERKNYDTVFVHMNQEYVLLGGVLWKLLGKKITMWRNHPAGNLMTDIAVMLCHDVFCTSRYSYTAQFKNTNIMPAGIDTTAFHKDSALVKKPNSILFLARIAPIKKQDLLIRALKILYNQNIFFTADFFGDPLPKDKGYANELREVVARNGFSDHITFKDGVPNKKTVDIYNQHEIFVNASPSGMYDKTIFEAMACETLILVSNENLKGQIDDRFLFTEGDEKDLAQRLKDLLSLDDESKKRFGKILRAYVVEHHSLARLADTLVKHWRN